MLSQATLLFKKGDPALCENYRPITLLAVGYKILALIMLLRLKEAEAEKRQKLFTSLQRCRPVGKDVGPAGKDAGCKHNGSSLPPTSSFPPVHPPDGQTNCQHR